MTVRCRQCNTCKCAVRTLCIFTGAYRLVADGYWYQAVDMVLVAAAEQALALQSFNPVSTAPTVYTLARERTFDVCRARLLTP